MGEQKAPIINFGPEGAHVGTALGACTLPPEGGTLGLQRRVNTLNLGPIRVVSKNELHISKIL